MNAQSIWAGHDYAYVQNRSKGVSFFPNARKVRAIKLSKTYGWDAQRATTMVQVFDYKSERTLVVRARDILDFWDDYEPQLLEYQRVKEEQARREAEDRQRRAAERDELVTILEDVLGEKVPLYNIHTELRTVTLGYDAIRKLVNHAESERALHRTQ